VQPEEVSSFSEAYNTVFEVVEPAGPRLAVSPCPRRVRGVGIPGGASLESAFDLCVF